MQNKNKALRLCLFPAIVRLLGRLHSQSYSVTCTSTLSFEKKKKKKNSSGGIIGDANGDRNFC